MVHLLRRTSSQSAHPCSLRVFQFQNTLWHENCVFRLFYWLVGKVTLYAHMKMKRSISQGPFSAQRQAGMTVDQGRLIHTWVASSFSSSESLERAFCGAEWVCLCEDPWQGRLLGQASDFHRCEKAPAAAGERGPSLQLGQWLLWD